MRCKAKAKSTSKRCARAAIAGAVVCRVHGGAAPQVRKAAAERLRDLVHPAIDGMQRALASDDLNAVVRASRDVLDRTGYQADAYSAEEVGGLLRAVTKSLLAHVTDGETRQLIGNELRRLSQGAIEIDDRLEGRSRYVGLTDEELDR